MQLSVSGSPTQKFTIGLLRGAAGALIFGIPMLMTMELWSLGFSMSRQRLLLLLLVNIPLLVVLAHRIGFERTFTLREAVRDATIAYGLGIVTSAAVLSLLGILTVDMPANEWLGKVALQSVPASIGAMLGRSQLGGSDPDEDEEEDEEPEPELSTGYFGELFMMGIGALFLGLNVAPTEEIILISYKMTPWHSLAAILVSIALMHGFVYAVAFRGTHQLDEKTPNWHALVRFTLPGYVVTSLISLYVLWTFGRLDDTGWTQVMMSMVVLNFPGAVGAASARLVL
ncbi:putative integral membrane protein (TIGR02587 family) [Neorhizobium galegae]|uniref:TIGR02587 family membrane protein n=1 Tax=Neorhizobium galegae TaxID=399 RepID=UPI001AE9E19E|nr:TIGR02587 family membrane protein [Neorhizobium galegae]MBP2550666.1 putative integral membrane protein (TIGR02587 family) [Neorhizobium galegae]